MSSQHIGPGGQRFRQALGLLLEHSGQLGFARTFGITDFTNLHGHVIPGPGQVGLHPGPQPGFTDPADPYERKSHHGVL